MALTAQHFGKNPQKSATDFASFLYQPVPQAAPHQKGSIPVPELKVLCDEWIATKARAGHSPRTTDLRKDISGKLFWFLNHKKHTVCGLPELEQFFDYCREGHNEAGGRWGAAKKVNVGDRARKEMAPATLLTYHTYIKSFFYFLEKREVLERSPFYKIEKPIYRPDQIEPFTEAQIDALIEAAGRSSIPLRNIAIVWFLLDTGVRVTEMCNITLNDVDFSEEESLRFRVVGKGKKKRTVRLGRTASSALWKYFRQEHGIRRRYNKVGRGEHVKIDKSTPVFMSIHRAHFGDPLTRSGVEQMIHDIGVEAGIGGVRCSPHTFRHTFAINFLRNGGDVFVLKAMLGHKSLKTVEIYLKIATADTDEQHRKYSPADTMAGRK